MESREMVLMTLFTGQQKEMQTKRTDFGTEQGKGRGDDVRKQHQNIYISLRKTDHQWEFAVLRENPEGWDEERGGREVREREHT